MALKIVLFLSLAALSMALPHMEFSIKEIEKIPKLIKTREDLIDFVTERKYTDNRKGKLTNFSFKDCGGPDALVRIESVTVGPDPIVLPGSLKISASINVKKTLDSPLVGNVTIQRKVFNTYVDIPCIDNIGSCHYDDLCDLLEMVTCPDALEKIGINCLCPLFKPAGINDLNLMIALEPEAASLYCMHLPVDKMSGVGNQQSAKFSKGTKYMVVDVGGGTADITVHEVIDEKSLKELNSASGGAWGGTRVDEAFTKFIIKLFGILIKPVHF